LKENSCVLIKSIILLLLFNILPTLELSSSPIIIYKWDSKFKNINDCTTKSSIESFILQPQNFNEIKNYPFKEIESASSEEANSRYTQIVCIKKLKLSNEENRELKKNYNLFRQRELEGLDFLKNYLLNFDKENKFAPGEKAKLLELLKIKSELYYILDRKTEISLFSNDIASEKEFVSIYQSILRSHFDILNALSPALRKVLLKKMYNT
jgi:hypothetical protein